MSKKEKSEPEMEVINATPIVRTPAGMREKLYDIWDDYAFGRIQASRVITFARLAEQINKTTVVELAVRRFTLENPSQPPLFPTDAKAVTTTRQ